MQEKYLQENKDRFLEELIELLKIPSVSADPSFAKDVRNAAEFIAVKMKDAGIENVSVDETAGYPVVYGDKMIDESLPTILVYGHYDVQPADPIELWNSPPFEPVIKDGYIYARGASDDKGQMYMHIKAYEMMIQTNTLPCNVKFMIEGEEEAGSNNLEPYVKANTEKLACDIVLVSDTGMIANDVPTITTGIRGMSYVEVEVVGPNRDLHSGMYGGAVANPLNILSKMIASLHNEKGEIMIPGFYDNVVDVSAAERETMAQAPFSLTEYKDHLDIEAVYGEEGFSTLERVSIRPTLDVNGMWGGYIGDGAKTVLPSKAHAKISMRLVPNQNSDRITKLFVEHFEKIAPKYVKIHVTPHHGGEPAVTPTDSIAYKAAEKALFKTFGKKAIPLRCGGSIPIVTMFEQVLGKKTVLLGFGLDSDAIHSPNEKFGLFNYYKGIETIPYFYKYFTELSK
ncbi:MAG: acetylornithine deacetylase/succinyl-diaminopimelate desuccinylase-like protein [Planctomycetota bacterium]|jgi:acetylornithine deacetylase/succinyl-diaminopimelate desuccinylase-like protein